MKCTNNPGVGARRPFKNDSKRKLEMKVKVRSLASLTDSVDSESPDLFGKEMIFFSTADFCSKELWKNVKKKLAEVSTSQTGFGG